MPKNRVIKFFQPRVGATYSWTAPAEVKQVKAYVFKTGGLAFWGSNNSPTQYTFYGLNSKNDGFSWGAGDFGQRGDNAITAFASTPVSILGGLKWKTLAGSDQTAHGLTTSGIAYGWGRNFYGEIGDNTIVSKSSPVLVLGGHSFVSLDAGRRAVTALKSNGQIWGWGENSVGSIGDNTVTNRSTPVLTAGSLSAVEIASGQDCAYALLSDGNLYAWGFNAFGELGDNTTTARSSPVQVLGGHSFVQVAPGGEFVYALKANGEAWAWGLNNVGQLGDNSNTNASTPVQVAGGHSFVQLGAVILGTGLGLKANGEVWAWGSNTWGYLGDGTVVDKSTPVLVSGGHSFVSIARRSMTVGVAFKANGEVWQWGLDSGVYFGQGTLAEIAYSTPILFNAPSGFNAPVMTLLTEGLYSVTPGQSYEIDTGEPAKIGSQEIAKGFTTSYLVALEYWA